MTKPALSIIVPYRDRLEHLRLFLPHIQRYFSRDKLDRDIPYSVTIVEQANSEEFNAGQLRNIGFLLSREGHDYFCFHDVDYLPIWADYSYCTMPTRIIWHGADRRPRDAGEAHRLRHDHERFFGAAVMLNKAHFELANGYSNGYPGWGYEDDDLRERCLACGLEIALRDGTFEPLTHRNRGHNEDLTPTEAAVRNRLRFIDQRPILRAGRKESWDGLRQTEFKLIETIRLEPLAGERPPAFLQMVRVDFTAAKGRHAWAGMGPLPA